MRGSQFGERGQHVKVGQDFRRLEQPLGLRSDPIAQGDEQVVFQLVDAFLRAEDFLLVFLQLGSDVALGVLESLLALVIARDSLAVCMGDFDVVAKHLVEADFQAWDAGAADLVGLEAGDPLLAAAGDLVQFVQLRVVAAPDHAALLGADRRVVHQGGVQHLTQVRAKVKAAFQLGEERGAAGRQFRLEPWHQAQGAADGAQVARRGPAGADTRRQPL